MKELSFIESLIGDSPASGQKSVRASRSYITPGGKRIAADVITLKRRDSGKHGETKPRLRFDKVVRGLMKRLQNHADSAMPGGVSVVLTVTAPIREPSKTAIAIQDKARSLLAGRKRMQEANATMFGNDVRIRLLKSASSQLPQVIGFVHNADTDAISLLNMTQHLLEPISAALEAPSPDGADERWLIVKSDRGAWCLEAYLHIFSQLRTASGFMRIFTVFTDGSIVQMNDHSRGRRFINFP